MNQNVLNVVFSYLRINMSIIRSQFQKGEIIPSKIWNYYVKNAT